MLFVRAFTFVRLAVYVWHTCALHYSMHKHNDGTTECHSWLNGFSATTRFIWVRLCVFITEDQHTYTYRTNANMRMKSLRWIEVLYFMYAVCLRNLPMLIIHSGLTCAFPNLLPRIFMQEQARVHASFMLSNGYLNWIIRLRSVSNYKV